MSSPDAYYREKLYPLQDGILRLVRELRAPLYLTGGTALSRAYFDHRYSEDVDLFTNSDPDFGRWVDVLFNRLLKEEHAGTMVLRHEATLRAPEFVRLTVSPRVSPDVELKVELVNDTAPHFGEIVAHPALGRVDSLRNMLSNKITASLRFAGKDMADLWVICRSRAFDWPSVWREAQEKESGLDPATVAEVLAGVPLAELDSVLWTNRPASMGGVRSDLRQISRDIVRGSANSFGVGKTPLEP